MPSANKLADRLVAHAQHPLLPADVRETMRLLTKWVLDAHQEIYHLQRDVFEQAVRMEQRNNPTRTADGAPDNLPRV
jgi:hypothetical protein